MWNSFAPSGRRPRGSTDDYQVCVTMVTLRRWADVGLWVALCVLEKISLPTSRLQLSQRHPPMHTCSRKRLDQNYSQISEEVQVFFIFRNYYFFENACEKVTRLRGIIAKAVSMPSRTASSFVIGGLRGSTATCGSCLMTHARYNGSVLLDAIQMSKGHLHPKIIISVLVHFFFFVEFDSERWRSNSNMSMIKQIAKNGQKSWAMKTRLVWRHWCRE